MQSPRRRTYLFVALLSLPAVALLAWRGVVHLRLQRIPDPRWDLPAQGVICWGDNDLAGARPGSSAPERVSETPSGVYPASRAALVAWHVIHRETGPGAVQHAFLYGEGPTLVQATFPDGEQRLAWRRISLISEDDMGMSGIAAALYLDAVTGEPLALVRGISVCEPSWSPLFMSADSGHAVTVWLQTSGPFALLALYATTVLFALAVSFGIRWLRARRRRTQT